LLGGGTTGDLATRYLFAGQQYDSASGLYSMRARYYDPNAGRFLSRDTWPVNYGNPMELNRYGYTAQNPTNWTDPSGNVAFFSYAVQLSKNIIVRGAAIGGIAGLLGSAVIYFGATSFDMCGPVVRDAMLKVNPAEFILQGTLIGIATGAFIAAGGSIFGAAGAGYATAAVGGVGAGTAIYDIYKNGANLCNVGGLILSVVGGTFGARAAANVIRNARVTNTDIPEVPPDTPEVPPDVPETPPDTPDTPPGRPPQLPQLLQVLRSFGLNDAQIEAFLRGENVVYEANYGATNVIGEIHFQGGRLSSGIVSITNRSGSGQLGFLRFRNQSFAVARALGLDEIEIVGYAVINNDILSLLPEYGFTPTVRPIPEALGGGLVDAFVKIFSVPSR